MPNKNKSAPKTKGVPKRNRGAAVIFVLSTPIFLLGTPIFVLTPPQTRQASGSQIDVFLVEAVVMNMVENLQASTSPLWKPRGSQIEPFLLEAVVMNMVENLLASPSPPLGPILEAQRLSD